MATTTTTTGTTETTQYQGLTTTRSTIVENPLGKLDSQAFLKLLLKELEYQDPTSPMDSEKMLSQTSQLTGLEAQNETKNAMVAMQSALATSSQMNAASIIGKVASLGTNEVTLTQGGDVTFGLRFTEAASNIQLTVKDSDGNVVNQEALGDSTSAYEQLVWQGKDNNGNSVAAGNYKLEATYTGADGTIKNADIAYMVDSVKFDGKTTLAKLGSTYVDVTKIKEFFQ
jgi:flagellar basal-body rod modification protein FlgD